MVLARFLSVIVAPCSNDNLEPRLDPKFIIRYTNASNLFIYQPILLRLTIK